MSSAASRPPFPSSGQVIKHALFRKGGINTNFIADHPELMVYTDLAPEGERLSRLVAEISAKGYNPYVQLGQYRSADTPVLGPFEPVLPPISSAVRRQASPYPQGDRTATLDYIRHSGNVHFTDTTPRDFTQSNSGQPFSVGRGQAYWSIPGQCGLFFH